MGFNFREGLVLQNVKFNNRSVMNKGSLVEMAVPYGDPRSPFSRKCAFDVGDYGLGYCAVSSEISFFLILNIYHDVTKLTILFSSEFTGVGMRLSRTNSLL